MLIPNQNYWQKQITYWDEAIAAAPTEAKNYVQRGMVKFKLAQITESIADFDQAEKLEPRLTPYLWQRGLSFYYAEKFAAGAKQFEIDLTVNSQDVEETVWRYLCIAQLQGIHEAINSLMVVKNDPRLVMQKVYDLYGGNCSINEVLKIGEKEGKRGKFYSHLYIGLYHEVMGDTEKARDYIVKSCQYQLDDYMWYLAWVHRILRNWEE